MRLAIMGAIGVTALAGVAAAGNESRMEAFGREGGLVEVVADFSEDAIYWCGAARYARSVPAGERPRRIYVWQGPAESRAKPGATAVTFGFTPPRTVGAVPKFSNSVAHVGNSMSLAAASQTCNERSASG